MTLERATPKGRVGGGEAAAATKHIWRLTYANKSEKRTSGTVVN